MLSTKSYLKVTRSSIRTLGEQNFQFVFDFRILQCGLRGFVGNANSTLDSEVGILGYLSFAYETDLKFALKEMLQVSSKICCRLLFKKWWGQELRLSSTYTTSALSFDLDLEPELGKTR